PARDRFDKPGDLGTPRISVAETFGSATAAAAGGHARSGRLGEGGAVDVGRALAAEGLQAKVDLVYVDPPFASQMAYVHEARLDGPADGRVVRTAAYDDRW